MPDIEEKLYVWQNSLCKEIDIGSLMARNHLVHKWKAPWRALLLREAVAWRLVDLLQQSVQLHKQKHVLGARILVRSAFETLAMLIYSGQDIRKVVANELNFHEFSKRTSKLLLGSRDKTTDIDSVNIVTILQRADKRFPGLLKWYETLCESAHPNYMGMLAGYSVSNSTEFITSFENRWEATYGSSHLDAVKACAVIFDAEYNHEWPDAFNELEKWIEANDEMLEHSKSAES